MAGWQAHYVRAPSEGGSDELDNCEALSAARAETLARPRRRVRRPSVRLRDGGSVSDIIIGERR